MTDTIVAPPGFVVLTRLDKERFIVGVHAIVYAEFSVAMSAAAHVVTISGDALYVRETPAQIAALIAAAQAAPKTEDGR